MEDYKIVDLYWARKESAIGESHRKYGRMLQSLSFSMLDSKEDAEECVNDTYLDAWNAMPTARPTYLGAFLSKITRRISIDRFRSSHRQKRGGMGEIMEELNECIPADSDVESEYRAGELRRAINRFVHDLSEEKRAMFVRRYFYTQSVDEIAVALGVGSSKVKVSLMRMRNALQKTLEEQELM